MNVSDGAGVHGEMRLCSGKTARSQGARVTSREVITAVQIDELV